MAWPACRVQAYGGAWCGACEGAGDGGTRSLDTPPLPLQHSICLFISKFWVLNKFSLTIKCIGTNNVVAEQFVLKYLQYCTTTKYNKVIVGVGCTF